MQTLKFASQPTCIFYCCWYLSNCQDRDGHTDGFNRWCLKVHTLLSLWNSMTFYDLPEFSTIYAKQLSSNYCQNNYNIFRYFLTWWCKECMLVFLILLELIGFLICLLFIQILIFLPVHSQKVYCFTMTFHDPHFNFWNSRPGKWNHKIPRLGKFSIWPVWTLCLWYVIGTCRFNELVLQVCKSKGKKL